MMIAEITIDAYGEFGSIKWSENGEYRSCPHCNITCTVTKAPYWACESECLDGTLSDIVYRIYRRGHLVVIQ